jgi:hypothetical protein
MLAEDHKNSEEDQGLQRQQEEEDEGDETGENLLPYPFTIPSNRHHDKDIVIESEIAGGAYGKVVKVEMGGKPYALKLVLRKQASDVVISGASTREIGALNMLKGHPNIVEYVFS